MATPSGNQHQNQQYLETFLLLLLLLLLTSVQMYLYLQEDKKKGKKINRDGETFGQCFKPILTERVEKSLSIWYP